VVIAIRNQPGQSPTPFTITSGKPTSNSHMRFGSVSNKGSSNSDDLNTVRFTKPLCRAGDAYDTLTPPSDPKRLIFGPIFIALFLGRRTATCPAPDSAAGQ
jgi:hypothetical protein